MDYNNTFETRCKEFKYAMDTYPHVMDEEFETAIEICSLQPHDTLLNIPAACIPLDKYFGDTEPKRYLTYETNKTFGALTATPHCELYSIPEQAGSITKIISLASLHHASDDERFAFYTEAVRLLNPCNGMLIIGDVIEESDQARWLNIFVDQYNPNGHKGKFWSSKDCELLENAGFVVKTHVKHYVWKFASTPELLDFIRHLFGVSRATDSDILTGVHTYLHPLHFEDGSIHIPWSLMYFISTISQTDVPNLLKKTDVLQPV